MNLKTKVVLFLLRVSMGWVFLYAGVTKLMDPNWTSAGFLKGSKTFYEFFYLLSNPALVGGVDFVNKWGLTLLGISLILGVGLRVSTALGSLLMVLYYLPRGIVHPDANSLVVDMHIVYIFALLLLGFLDAGKYWGLKEWAEKRFPDFKELI